LTALLPNLHNRQKELMMREESVCMGSISARPVSTRQASASNSSLVRILFLIILAVPIIPSLVFAKRIELAWDANPASSKTAGYRVYYSQKRGHYTKDRMKDVGKATRCVLDLSEGNWYFAVTAYDSRDKESGYSAEISWPDNAKTAPPAQNARKPIPPASSSPQGNKITDQVQSEPKSAKPLIPPRAHLEYLPKSDSDDTKTLIPPSVNRPGSRREKAGKSEDQ
jgi:hypothetical protein